MFVGNRILSLLLWKNFVMQSRHKTQLFVQLFLMLIFYGIVVTTRSVTHRILVVEKIYYKEPINALDKLYETLGLTNSDQLHGVAFTPQNKIIENIIQMTVDNLKMKKYESFQNEIDMAVEVNNNNFLVGIEFPNYYQFIEKLPEKFDVTLRFPAIIRHYNEEIDMRWNTRFSYQPLDTLTLTFQHCEYLKEGFLAVQHELALAYIESVTKQKISHEILINSMNHPPEYLDDGFERIQSTWTFSFVFANIYIAICTTRFLAIEKKTHMKELLNIVGVQNWMNWIAWFIKTYTMFALSTLLMVILFKIPFKKNLPVLIYSDTTAIVCYFMAYNLGAVTLCFLISTFHSSPNVLAFLTILIWLIQLVPYQLLDHTVYSAKTESLTIFSFFINCSVCLGIDMIVLLESRGVGLQWYNMFDTDTLDCSYTIGNNILIMLGCSCVYMLLCLYIETVFPGKFGLARKWYFPFTLKFCNRENLNIDYSIDSVAVEYGTIALSDVDSEDGFESLPLDKHHGIDIIHLTKLYKDDAVAVDNMLLRVYENEITMVLGHNGAGKSTAFSIITGLELPTSGTVFINDYDIVTQTRRARLSLGICAQKNILFKELTVEEHLDFFCRLKGFTDYKIIKDDIDYYINKIRLEDARHVPAGQLSEGIKRKLSVCIAFCGGSKVIVCDEPTTCVDAASCQQIWNFFLNERRNRTILLTSHNMNEAEYIADRVAVMSSGKIKACGSVFFLKKKFGVGYRLICRKAINFDDTNTKNVTTLINNHVENYEIEHEDHKQLIYLLPDEESGKFEILIIDLEKNLDTLKLTAIDVVATTMEDVFISLIENQARLSMIDNHTPVYDRINIGAEVRKLHPRPWRAMFIKKSLITKRNKLFLLQIMLPLLCILFIHIGKMVNLFGIHIIRPFKFTLDSYNAPIILINDKNNFYDFKGYLKNAEIIETNDIKEFFLNLDTLSTHIDFHNHLGGIQVIYSNQDIIETIIIWVYYYPVHVVPLILNAIHNVMLRKYADDFYEISITNYPFRLPQEKYIKELSKTHIIGLFSAIFISGAMGFVTSLYIFFLKNEKKSKAKLLQFINGITPWIFWTTHFAWDYFIYFISIMVLWVLIIFFAESVNVYSMAALLIVLIFYGLAAISFTYIASEFSLEIPSAFALLLAINLATGPLLLYAFHIALLRPYYRTIVEWLHNFCLGECLLRIFWHTEMQVQCIEGCKPNTQCNMEIMCNTYDECCLESLYQWSSPGIGRHLMKMFLVFLFFSTIMLLRDLRFFRLYSTRCLLKMFGRFFESSIKSTSTDNDVINERIRVANMTKADIAAEHLVVANVSKYYLNRVLAVRNVSFAIGQKEIFGLTGMNGAGKSTLLKMLTGAERFSEGKAYVRGIDLEKNLKKAYKELDYCPSGSNGLLDDLSGRENIRIYCVIIGLPDNDIQDLIKEMAVYFNFKKSLDMPLSTCNIVTKRKLNVSLAVINAQALIVLDQPTSGMDPVVRRKLWTLLKRAVKTGKSVIIKTHDLNNCENMCTRMAIMYKGELQCIGTPRYIRNKFVKGLVLKLRIIEDMEDDNPDESVHSFLPNVNRLQSILRLFKTTFPGVELTEHSEKILTFRIPLETISWAVIFGFIERNKTALNIQEYTITQTTLEEIFIDLSK